MAKRWRMIAAASAGNALEFYDFLIYGFFAQDVAAAFFPGKDATTKLLLSFGTFGVSFLARPIGAAVLGALADRRGRSFCMVISVALMTSGSAAITFMPPYATIGLAAPIGVLLARLIQGFGLGGEFGSATALMIEHSAGRESQAASWQITSQTVALLLASSVAYSLNLLLPADIFHRWGFRTAFCVGTLAGPAALFFRRQLADAPSFVASLSSKAAPDEQVSRPSLGGIIITACMVATCTAQAFLVVYLPTYATRQLHMPANQALGVVVLLCLATLALLPLRLTVARKFDRSHRSLFMILSCLALMACAYPGFAIMNLFPGPATLFLVPFIFTFVGLPYNAPLIGFMGMVFSIHHRGVGLSVGYALGIALFGGFAPYINTWLIAHTHDACSPAFYLVLTASITMVAIFYADRRLPSGRSLPASARHPVELAGRAFD